MGTDEIGVTGVACDHDLTVAGDDRGVGRRRSRGSAGRYYPVTLALRAVRGHELAGQDLEQEATGRDDQQCHTGDRHAEADHDHDQHEQRANPYVPGSASVTADDCAMVS